MNKFLPISEKSAVNTLGGRKRGRKPNPDFGPMQYANATTRFGARSKRGQQNLIYADRAIEILNLKGAENFEYLLYPKPKLSILAELGRHKSVRMIEHLANEICLDSKLTVSPSKLSSKKYVERLREYRGAIRSCPTAGGVKKAILAAINNYLKRHPTTTAEIVYEAIQTLKIFPMGQLQKEISS